MKIGFLALLLSSCIVSLPDPGPKHVEAQASGFAAGRQESDYEIVLRAVQSESKKLGIPSLSEAPSNSASEVRIWVGFARAYPRLVVLKLEKGKEGAVFFTATRGPQTTMTESSLKTPRSGWIALQAFLRDRGVTSPIALALDDKHIPDADEELIVIETGSGRSYSMVFFPTVTKAADGKRALEVCETMEREFDVQMGCRYKA